MERKELKKIAKSNTKKHYALYVIVCLIAAVMGVAYTASISLFQSMIYYDLPEGETQASYNTTVSGVTFTELLEDILEENEAEREQKRTSTGHLGMIELGKKDGVLANFINTKSAGSPLISIVSAVHHMIRTKSLEMVGIFLSSVFILLVWIFFVNTYHVLMARFFLEGRLYEKLSIDKFLWLVRQKSFVNASMTMLVRYIFQTLWNITLIGGAIKHYSYAMVPFIVAENPEIKPLQAITLSKKMMKGHKWELFVVDLSFILWYIADMFSLGLLSLFFLAPYEQATFTEYYVKFRKQAKKEKIVNTEKLNDSYLYRFAQKEELQQQYSDIESYRAIVSKGYTQKQGAAKFLASAFGVVWCYNKSEEEYSHYMEAKLRLNSYEDVYNLKSYPTKLFPNTVSKDRKAMVESLHYIRHYSVFSLILIFFLLCFVGWSWEVALHLVSDGVFVNRGVMHGPWLPIYGAGSVMIMVLLNKFRDTPIVEFLTAIVLCGIVEFFTSLQLEKSMGQKWWDYSGYFLNVDGRICAEGLLVFGIGGIAVVYLVAPLIDNMIKKMKFRTVVPICLILLSVFIADSVYSHYYPNTGKGITDYPTVTQTEKVV